MSSQPSPHKMSNDLLKRILLTTVHKSGVGEGVGFSNVSESVFGGPNTSDALNTAKILKSTVREDALLTAAAYSQRHYHEAPLSASSIGAFEQDSNLEDYSMDDLSPQGLNGSGDDPMLTIGLDHDSSGTNEHSNSDAVPSSEGCFLTTQISQEKIMKKKGRPAKSFIASSAHGRFGVRCPVCSKAFNNSSALAKHKLTHSDERKYVCQTCSKTFKRQDHLNGHMLTHSSKKPFECKYKDCGKSYCDARSLKRHLEHHHTIDGAFSKSSQTSLISYDASTYSKQTSNVNSSLTGKYTEPLSPVSPAVGSSNGVSDKAHLLTSSSVNFGMLNELLPHKCDLCNRSFKNLPALNGHMRLHGGYIKKDGAAYEFLPWNLGASKRKPSSLSSASISSTIQGSENTLTKLTDISTDLLQPDPNPQYLPQISQIQSICPGFHQTTSAVNVDSGGCDVSASDALGTQQEAAAMATMHATDNEQMHELASRIQVLNMPPSFTLSLNPVDFLKLHDHRMAYLSPDSVSGVGSEAKGITSADDSLTNIGQHFYQIGSLPALSLVPCLTFKKSDVAASSETHFPHGCGKVEASKNYKRRLELAKKNSFWIPEKTLDSDDILKENEIEKHSSDHDEASTDSAKDTDEEESALYIKDIKYHHERRRWASADADRFTSGKSKTLTSDSGLLEFTGLNNTGWKIDTSLSAHRFAAEPFRNETNRDSPPTIDHIQNLGETVIDDQIEGEFRNPTVTPALLLKFRRKNRPEPLIIPPQCSGFAFHSRLRSPRIGGGNLDTKLTFTPYTPPPMLSPIRSGSGLFCQLSSLSPVSAPVGLRTGFTPRRNSRGSILAPFPVSEAIAEEEVQDIVEQVDIDMESELPVLEPPPETDISPHVNIGADYQAEIPSINPNRQELLLSGSDKEVLVWDPSVMQNIKECEVRAFMDFACCAAVPFNGSNKEYAHHLLSICGGNIKKAVVKLMLRNPCFSSGQSLHSYVYQEADIWSTKEIEAFQDALTKFDKDFFRVSKHVGSKSSQKCIQFYYMWKKVACDEHKRLRIIRRKREQENLYNLRSSKAGVNKEQPNFSSEGLQLPFSDYVASDNSVSGEPEDVIAETDLPFSGFHVSCDLQYEETVETEEYPCRICGKVFGKIKSRSAHMKTHRPMGSGSQQTDRNRQTYGSQDSWQFNLP